MPTGEEVKLRCRAPGTVVTVRSLAMRLDFAGHCVVVRKTGAPPQLQDIQLVADLPDAGGAEDGGRVTVAGDDRELTATVSQPGAKTETTSTRPPTLDANGLPTGPAGFVLATAPESTVLQIEDPALEPESTT